MKATKAQVNKTKQILSDIIYTKRTKLGLSQEALDIKSKAVFEAK